MYAKVNYVGLRSCKIHCFRHRGMSVLCSSRCVQFIGSIGRLKYVNPTKQIHVFIILTRECEFVLGVVLEPKSSWALLQVQHSLPSNHLLLLYSVLMQALCPLIMATSVPARVMKVLFFYFVLSEWTFYFNCAPPFFQLKYMGIHVHVQEFKKKNYAITFWCRWH